MTAVTPDDCVCRLLHGVPHGLLVVVSHAACCIYMACLPAVGSALSGVEWPAGGRVGRLLLGALVATSFGFGLASLGFCKSAQNTKNEIQKQKTRTKVKCEVINKVRQMKYGHDARYY